MKIAVVGTGYVSLPNTVLLSQHIEVVDVGIVRFKLDMANAK